MVAAENQNEGKFSIMNLKILAVEDDEESAHLIEDILNAYFETKIVLSGEEALEVVNQFKPDIVVLDRILPGISGDEVAKQILANEYLQDVKIVMVSSLTSQEDIKQGFIAGADYYLPKPFDHDQLLALIERIINAKISEGVKDRYL